MIALAARFFLGSTVGRSIGFGILLMLAVFAWKNIEEKRAVAAALAAAETERQEINNGLATDAIEAREALRRCRDLRSSGMQWDWLRSRCIRSEGGGRSLFGWGAG